ncbi:unnamed protein product, partial [Candidula unifasciata]
APPSQRVQFLLGEEEDEEHKTHDIFCQMAELSSAGDEREWKETASRRHGTRKEGQGPTECYHLYKQGTCMLEMDAVTIEQIA